MTAKVSITLPEEILKALDRLIEERRIPSPSAAIQTAVSQYVTPDSREAYIRAMQEWEDKSEKVMWDAAAGDGIA